MSSELVTIVQKNSSWVQTERFISELSGQENSTRSSQKNYNAILSLATAPLCPPFSPAILRCYISWDGFTLLRDTWLSIPSGSDLGSLELGRIDWIFLKLYCFLIC